ncbi:DNA-binding protein HU-alpha [Litoreibacter ponti]|uniref:DNA-binding protein HU-alpha n=1 Tax=Litoreibacter ponti TaxID=1510457 RepID=A0A2T6BI83_9RHOB|nr:HU family DNA-binding protein [Litoreibacter ponti]PTX55765.1 DNA-binding protein HU-alpha [Litoreibacter ponti]
MATKPTTKTKTKRSKTLAASKTPTAAAKTAPKAKVVATKAPATAPDVPGMDPLTKKELVERMVAQSGMKKGDARRALEATMGVIAGALREGRDMNLPPLGKIKIARSKETPNGKLVVLRAKLKEPGGAAPKDPLAEAAE